MRLVAIVLALAALAALPHAAAQFPFTACGPLQIPTAPTAPSIELGAGETIEIPVSVVNSGQLAATVTVVAAIDEAGWTVVTTPDPASVPGGGTGTFTFVVGPTEEASADGLVRFSASGTCETPLGAACPGAACVPASASTQVGVPLRVDQGFRIPGLGELDFPVEYLIAAVVLVGLAAAIPLAMRRRQAGGLTVDCPEPLKMVVAGRGASFPIELRNPRKEASTAQFEVGPVPEGWSAFMPAPEVQLAARESRSLWLMVRSPPNAPIGSAVEVDLRLRDPRRKGEAASVRVRAEVQSDGTA